MQIAEITRSETSERAALLRVASYDVELDLTVSTEVFRSTAVIRFTSVKAGASTYADLVATAVHEVTLNGVQLDPTAACQDGRITLTGLAEENELRVVADCAFGTDGSGLHRAVDSADGKVYCYTQFEAADARRAYANFEQPDLKAEFTFHVVAPAHWVVLSNQPAPEPEDAGDGNAIWHFAATPRISTYLTAVVAGEYHVARDTHTTPAGQVVPLRLACRQSLASYLEPADMFTVTKQGLDFYTGLFQGPYPFAKYDQVIVPDFLEGAMENVGCVTFSEHFLFRSKVTDASYETRTLVILHEMSHMWFGDLVTMRWWDDLWLNESFAEFSAFLASAEATRFTGAWTTFCGGRKIAGYLNDQQPSTHPIAADAPVLSVAIANFDGISYAKGAAVLKQLAAYLGRERFFAGVRAYFAAHSWRNATLGDLVAELETSSGSSLQTWVKAWLETAGPNTLRPDFAVDGSGVFTEFTITQTAPHDHPTLRPHHIAVGLYDRIDGELVRTYRVEVDVAGDRTAVAELVGRRQPDLVLLNDDDLGYAIVRFDERSLHTLTSSIGEFRDSLARTICWSALLDMALQAEISLRKFVRIVAAGMGDEQSISVLQMLLAITGQLLAMSADPAWLPECRSELASAAIALLHSAEPGSDRQLTWMQLLAANAVRPDHLDLLSSLLDGSSEIAGLSVDTELRWALLKRLATMGRASDADIDAELAKDDTDAGNRHALACKAAVPAAANKAEAWRLLTESDDLASDGAIEISQGFRQAEHADLIAAYTERYFEKLPEIWATRGEQFRVRLATVLFPYTALSRELLDRVDEFLADDDLNPGLARVLVQGRDMVAKALRARELPA
jgi:aminopeptidase N